MQYKSWLRIRKLTVSYLDFHSYALLVTRQTSISTCYMDAVNCFHSQTPCLFQTRQIKSNKHCAVAQALFSCSSPPETKYHFGDFKTHRHLLLILRLVALVVLHGPSSPVATFNNVCASRLPQLTSSSVTDPEPSARLKMFFHFVHK